MGRYHFFQLGKRELYIYLTKLIDYPQQDQAKLGVVNLLQSLSGAGNVSGLFDSAFIPRQQRGFTFNKT